MAPDFAASYLSSPFGLGLLLAILVIPTVFARAIAWQSFQRLGLRQVAQGYCAIISTDFVILALLVLKGGGGMQGAGYMFILSLIFVLPFASLVVMPVSVLLVRVSAATVALMAAAGVASALALSTLIAAYPSNEWGRTHRLEAFFDTAFSVGVAATLFFCAFAFGARMPLWRRSPHLPAAAASKAA
ncbi:hypothetical protein ACSFA2_25235 [Variovorax sp. LT2P21]|uniref:hypothetical protein n=1 Tax=Variovorax sp. LT2P21 TaxID=3443731 RepID=UPI003F447193